MASTEPGLGLCIPAHTAAPSTFSCAPSKILADTGALGCCQRELAQRGLCLCLS